MPHDSFVYNILKRKFAWTVCIVNIFIKKNDLANILKCSTLPLRRSYLVGYDRFYQTVLVCRQYQPIVILSMST